MLCIPVLEPNLNGALSHVNLLCDTIPHGSGWGRILIELYLERVELVLCSPLTLLILLLLGESTLAWWTARRRAIGGDG